MPVKLVKDKGNSPVNEFTASAKMVRFVQKPSSKGIEEFKELLPRSSFESSLSWPIEEGIVPSNELLYNSIICSFDIEPISSGMKPLNWFSPRRRCLSLESWGKFGDSGPWNKLLVRLRYSSLPRLENTISGIDPLNLFRDKSKNVKF
ncbi:hypothetical protein CIPAW_03G269000 [Carya illinoinensis]|uniref:Uncharacterized protein n=1 Tax=Carya illinoinensis TaxID=32201 RepID=A0A8T1R5Y4_CARIL|nr:hypothetical protein CIPAW_03G269000 [Carya illinoinensis]